MKKNFILPLAAILFLPLSVTSCTEEADGENIGEAASLLLDNDSVTLVQGHDITVNITRQGPETIRQGLSMKVS